MSGVILVPSLGLISVTPVEVVPGNHSCTPPIPYPFVFCFGVPRFSRRFIIPAELVVPIHIFSIPLEGHRPCRESCLLWTWEQVSLSPIGGPFSTRIRKGGVHARNEEDIYVKIYNDTPLVFDMVPNGSNGSNGSKRSQAAT